MTEALVVSVGLIVFLVAVKLAVLTAVTVIEEPAEATCNAHPSVASIYVKVGLALFVLIIQQRLKQLLIPTILKVIRDLETFRQLLVEE